MTHAKTRYFEFCSSFPQITGLILASVFVLCSACNKSKQPLDLPETYDASTFEANTASQQALRTQYELLLEEAYQGRIVGQVLNYQDLSVFFNVGTPTLKSVTAPLFAQQLDKVDGWLGQLATNSGGEYVPGPTAQKGGVYQGFLFDQKGMETTQFIEKGLLAAAFYYEASRLGEGGVTLEEADQMLALYGANPLFPNTPTPAPAMIPDGLMAKYAAERDKNDGNGLYSQIKANFIRLQAAIKAGDKYKTDQEDAFEDILYLWEKASFATIVHCARRYTDLMSASNLTEADRAEALHHYGEMVGALYGWYMLPELKGNMPHSKLASMLALLKAQPEIGPTAYLFVVDPYNSFPLVYDISQKIQLHYQFSIAEMEDFANNWVAVQGR